MNLLVVGSGVIGAATGIGFGRKGNAAIFHDVNEAVLKKLKKKGYHVVETISEAIDQVDVIFICVPTPTVNKKFDYSYLEDAAAEVGKAMRGSSKYRVVVVRSTCLPSTTRCRILPLLELKSGNKAGKDFGVCHNPEFLREEHSLEDFENPSRIVIGEFDKKSGDVLEKLYSSFEVPIFRMDLDSAETVKYVSNLFLATRISFFNEVFLICQKFKVDSNIVSEATACDPRIGEYGIHGGRPFDGKCLPKDLEAFLTFVHEKGENPTLFEAVSSVNKTMFDCKLKPKAKAQPNA